MASITIQCTCKTSFRIVEENLRESITCPNCNRPLNEDQLKSLKEGISKLSLVKKLGNNQAYPDKPVPFKFAVSYEITE